MDTKRILRFYQLIEDSQNELNKAQIMIQEAKALMDQHIEELENILGKEVKNG